MSDIWECINVPVPFAESTDFNTLYFSDAKSNYQSLH